MLLPRTESSHLEKRVFTGYGLSYQPYETSGACKTASEVLVDVANIAAAGYTLIRLYNTDCNSVPNVFTAARAEGLKLFLTISSLSTVDADTTTIINTASADWTIVDTVSIGNELVSQGLATTIQVTAAISSVRSSLVAAGFTGSVVAAETVATIISNPTLCSLADYCAIIAHPYYAGVAAYTSGTWIQSQISLVESLGTGKTVSVSETGWPTAGDANGNAIPSLANQQLALSALKSAVGGGVNFFEAFDSPWAASGAYDVGQYWGILN